MISRTIPSTISLFSWIACALVLTGLLKQNRGSARLRPDGKVHFLLRWWFACSWVFIMVRFGFIGSSYLRDGLSEPLKFATGVLICIGVAGSFAMIPGTIVTTNESLEQVRWFWRTKRIRWTEIEEIVTERRGSAITVRASDHRKIIYTNVYPDRQRFLLEIKRHCGNNLPPHFPDEPNE